MDRIYHSPTNLGVYTYGNAYGRPRFWERQSGDVPTQAQRKFDIAFGLVIPVLCFVFDPIVFRDYGPVGVKGIYQPFRFFAYSASALEIATLACWLFVIPKFPAWSRPAGGVMAAGAFFSFVLGVAILPLSLIGLLFAGIGALGFVPFATAVVYLRNARRALRLNRTSVPVRGGAAVAFAFGLAFALCLPAVAQRGAKRVVRSASAEVVAGGELSTGRQSVVRALTFLTGETFEDLVKDYQQESDDVRKSRLAEAYREVTGREINDYRSRGWLDD